MSTRTLRRGLSSSGVILSVVGVAAVVGAGAYLMSDVWSTKIDSAYSQFSEWTPENIAKDPKNYLKFCEKQAKAAQTKLKARNISIKQSKAKLAAKQEDAQKKVELGKKALTELKELRDGAESSNSWPVKFHEIELTKEALGKQAIKLRKEMDQKAKLSAVATKGLKQLALQETKVSDALQKLDEQLTEITSKREMLEIKEITEDITEDLVSMRGVLEGVVEIGDEEPGSFSLDDLADADATDVNDADIDAAFEGI